ncbi:2-dehydro-3-deoxy-6-phosphogalactonate aldolase [Vibrio mediterranei]
MFEITKHKYPFVAILRGVTPEEIIPIANVLVEEGFTMLEVPLNSPFALESITKLVDKYSDRLLVGAGTVTNAKLAKDVINTGANLIVTPNYNPDVIALCKANKMTSFVGVMTVTEAFNAIESGADVLKLFPANIIGLDGFKGMKAVLPKDVLVFPVGGISASKECLSPYLKAGAKGFGLGSALYEAGDTLEQVRDKAKSYISSYRSLIY